MASYFWDSDMFARWTAKYAQAEQRFTNEQLEYVRRYYRINKYAQICELEAIASQWNIYDFDFYMSLYDWFVGRQMIDVEIEERRYQGQKAAA
ncbi:unnamed protein product [Rotaria sordida]|uniref:Uncharacterized protein n=1 Tax=Rotaria sordida TaxID=392033 RepID=A0A814U6J5_9BILA|nr:unnamed protein product [Rotaria sordida]